ncbi:MAG: alanine racemase [Chloroflexi bacterium]|nr:alanine racemase [Chloroflexota bacterium]
MRGKEHPVLWAEVDLSALQANVRALKRFTAPHVELMAVVKANAYGHGAVPVARAALAAGATRLAVHRLEEGIALREAGITAPILLLGYTRVGSAEKVVQYRLTPTVNSEDFARALNQWAPPHFPVHIKVDTGLSRFGLAPEEVLPFVRFLQRLSHVQVEGIYTHFATADELDPGPVWDQWRTFLDVLGSLNMSYGPIPFRHACNSAATLRFPQAHLDGIRPGIALYGMAPSTEWPSPIPLRPVLSLKSVVVRVHTLRPGTAIGYGRTYVVKQPTRVALVPIGYGDGYPRALSNRGAVLIQGRRAPILGRVSMDQVVVDVSHIPHVQLEDEVVILGDQGEDAIRAEEIARWAGTINYEITTHLLPRVPRVYVGC